jgi:FtsZ-binding cell division protein ZapB
MNIEVLEKLERRINDSLQVIRQLREEKEQLQNAVPVKKGADETQLRSIKEKLNEITYWLDDLEALSPAWRSPTGWRCGASGGATPGGAWAMTRFHQCIQITAISPSGDHRRGG